MKEHLGNVGGAVYDALATPFFWMIALTITIGCGFAAFLAPLSQRRSLPPPKVFVSPAAQAAHEAEVRRVREETGRLDRIREEVEETGGLEANARALRAAQLLGGGAK